MRDSHDGRSVCHLRSRGRGSGYHRRRRCVCGSIQCGDSGTSTTRASRSIRGCRVHPGCHGYGSQSSYPADTKSSLFYGGLSRNKNKTRLHGIFLQHSAYAESGVISHRKGFFRVLPGSIVPAFLRSWAGG